MNKFKLLFTLVTAQPNWFLLCHQQARSQISHEEPTVN